MFFVDDLKPFGLFYPDFGYNTNRFTGNSWYIRCVVIYKRMKMNGVLYCFFFCIVAFSGCKSGAVIENGVSRELALDRKSNISDLSYDLFFNIPEQKQQPVDGRVKIHFFLKEKKEILLDFRENGEKVRQVEANGQKVQYRILNEHIIIPPAALKLGENTIGIEFIAGDQSLNRNNDFLYTLLVPDRARTLFPCFDQPDLKALFTLSLEIPSDWLAIANAPEVSVRVNKGRQHVLFAQTEPLSTYLFSFVAGKLTKETQVRNDREIGIYHRENDPKALRQIDTIFSQIYASLDWLEKYTGISYPFAKYDAVILPGFQYGGMEHTGATLYNDKRMFLSDYPTIDEELSRAELIAHETAHMWFGDYVTMEWFDDVWTKEVFANYFAALMTEPHFPAVNHRLSALKSFFPASYSEDRTLGSNAIKQPLDNLNSAGLIYGNIIYNKAPVVMKMLVKLMGEDVFQKGIREYLATYAYSNATWDGLIAILDKHTDANLVEWSRVWVHEKGMPVIETKLSGHEVKIVQYDPFSQGRIWPQDIELTLIKGNSVTKMPVRLYTGETVVNVAGADYVLPDLNGESYGYFKLDQKTADYCLKHLVHFEDPLQRLSVIMILNENMLNGVVNPDVFISTLLDYLPLEKNQLIYSAAMDYLKNCYRTYVTERHEKTELALISLPMAHSTPFYYQVAFRALLDVFTTPAATEYVFDLWSKQRPVEGLRLSESDYTKMAYELAVRIPEKSDSIIYIQLGRITNPDCRREFQFIAPAVVSDSLKRNELFNSLLKAENRRIEPWAARALYYLNHPLRQHEAVKYIRPALDVLQEVQRTGDIFFPRNWISSCLSGHSSLEAEKAVEQFLYENPDYPVLLKNKILQSADHLRRKTLFRQ